MEADLRFVRLNRKIIRDSNIPQDGENKSKEHFYATDYFDILKIEKRELTDNFTSIMGIWPDQELDIADIAAQSYSLYCSSDMLEKENEYEVFGNPFDVSEEKRGMPFLSIIQVHITPEIIVHALPEYTADIFLDAIYCDLLDIIGGFFKADQEQIFVARIYKMLSAGDFAVVVRSFDADTSFQISTLLRLRTAKMEERLGTFQLTLYKTYTLLTLTNSAGQSQKKVLNDNGSSVVEHENADLSHERAGEESQDKKGCFVLRCCYSNRYWSNKTEIDRFFKGKNLFEDHKLYGLNGRYDFCVYLSTEEFLDLFEDISEYKESGSMREPDYSIDVDKTNISITEYIRYLLGKHYLSYINERYLVESGTSANVISFKNKVSDIIKITANPIRNRGDFLDEKITKMYERVIRKYTVIRREIEDIKCYRKNLKHYVNLAEKLICLCFGINGFADTRIYAAVLLEQLDAIIDSMEIYIAMMQLENESVYLLNLLEGHIRESVCALDRYAQYIRNNNLQSLQTPNYNIESNTSVEKLLIGYSEFLKTFIDFYQKEQTEVIDQKKNIPHQFLPVVVPVLERRDVSVEILFPEGMMQNWRREKELREKLAEQRVKNTPSMQKRDRYCMVISIPTLTELGYVSTMVASLFHEVAHQFRYESRKERNDAVLVYVIESIMNILTREVQRGLQQQQKCMDARNQFEKLLQRPLAEAYLEKFCMNEEGEIAYEFQNVPFYNFLYCLRQDVAEKLSYWAYADEIQLVVEDFVKTLYQYYHEENSTCKEAILLLDEYMDDMLKIVNSESSESEKEKSITEKRENIIRCAYGMSWECARQNVRGHEQLWDKSKFSEWVVSGEDIKYELKWKQTFGRQDAESNQSLAVIWNAFFKFSTWIYDTIAGDTRKLSSKSRDDFLRLSYKKACSCWAEDGVRSIRNDLLQDPNSNLEALGRGLGIDCENDANFSVYKKVLESAIEPKLSDMIEMITWHIHEYREETADLFMCNAMSLTPFGYLYLLSINWPDNPTLPREYFNRSMNVLLMQWCLNDQKEPEYAKYRSVIVGVMEELKEALDKLQRSYQYDRNTFDKIQEEISELSFCWDKEDEDEVLVILDKLETLMRICEDMKESIDVQSKDRTTDNKTKESMKGDVRLLTSFVIMLEIISQLVEHSEDQIDCLLNSGELLEDYKKGVEVLHDLNEKMYNNEDCHIKKIGNFCREISGLLNRPCLRVDSAQEYARLNQLSIEFLLDMYYNNKRRIAQETGGDSYGC